MNRFNCGDGMVLQTSIYINLPQGHRSQNKQPQPKINSKKDHNKFIDASEHVERLWLTHHVARAQHSIVVTSRLFTSVWCIPMHRNIYINKKQRHYYEAIYRDKRVLIDDLNVRNLHVGIHRTDDNANNADQYNDYH